MKKILITAVVLAIVWFAVYALAMLNCFLTMKYEIEGNFNSLIIDKVYSFADTIIILNLVWFIISMILFIALYKAKKKQ